MYQQYKHCDYRWYIRIGISETKTIFIQNAYYGSFVLGT